MTTFSAGAALFPTAAPAEPTTDTWAAIVDDGRGATALKRSTNTLALHRVFSCRAVASKRTCERRGVIACADDKCATA
jgi:hypothetical protein